MPTLTGKSKIAFDAFATTAAEVFKLSRTEEANSSNDLSLKRLFNNKKNKYGNWDWQSEYSRNVINDSCTLYNTHMESPEEHLTPAEFESTYLPDKTGGQKNWTIYAKLADKTSPLELIPKWVVNSSKIGKAAANEEEGKGFTNLFDKRYDGKILKRLFVLLEKLTLKKRRGGSIEWEDIPEDLRKYFPAKGDKRRAILLAIQNFVSAEKIQEEYCESTIGGDEYTPEEIAKKFQGEIDALLDALDAFLKGRNIDGTNGNAALGKLGIVNNVNDFLVVAEALFQGIQISLDVVIKKKVYRGVAVGVVSLFICFGCLFVLFWLSSLMHLSSSHSMYNRSFSL